MDFGVIVIVAVVLAFIPALLGGLSVLAALLGWVATEDAKSRYEGSELIALEHPEPAGQ